MNADTAAHALGRRAFLAAGLSTAAAAVSRAGGEAPASQPDRRTARDGFPRPVKAFCIDFNWLAHRPARPDRRPKRCRPSTAWPWSAPGGTSAGRCGRRARR